MYQFKIIELPDGGYRFELGAIKLLVDKFSVQDNKHLLINPQKVVGYFSFDGNLYGVSNDGQNLVSAEAFYDSMSKQYLMFTNAGNTNSQQDSFRQTA